MADGQGFPVEKAGLAGKTVMVTGAGGSVGQALCTQLVEAGIATLILLELNELALFTVQTSLEEKTKPTGANLVPVIGCVTNRVLVDNLLNQYSPDLVIHAAALKHVPIVERNAVAGARINLLGTRTVARAACAAGVATFVLISTDKAVDPSSVMGATKRAAEMVVRDLDQRNPGTNLCSVRFGNVFGSSGSVVPVFADQIARGGPVTVTDPGMTRYFMTPRQAVRLVLQTACVARGGETFVLDMGHPVHILDLARGMIAARGLAVLEPGQAKQGYKGIEIVLTGKRPGEKMSESLFEVGCTPVASGTDGILCLDPPCPDGARIGTLVEAMKLAVKAEDAGRVRFLLQILTGADLGMAAQPASPRKARFAAA